ncbi:MAG: LLM class flavin-dependent oxidoreductase [Actinomycetota bacterium]|nr:LLM class flavin-dependent oxidoreductase [Actinomycetota bacterium]
MDISCAFPPMADTPAHIELAERLGYHRAWVFDTPTLQLDVWMTLALTARRTSRIGLGPGVLIPSLRHPMVTASAIAHLSLLAPDRIEVGVGAGFTGRNAMGQRGLKWSTVVDYVATVQHLLAGDTVEVEGARTRMLHWAGQAPERPIAVPWRLAVGGPKGMEAARGLGTSIFLSRPSAGDDYGDFPGVTGMVSGVVLDEDEPVDSPRALATAGPGVAILYHLASERRDGSVSSLPNGDRFLELVEGVPEDVRHLTTHEGHLSQLNAIDRQVLDAAAMRRSALLCTADQVPAWAQRYADMGVTELTYEPMGDIPDALTRFATAMGLG